MEGWLYVGLDVGSSAVHYAVLDKRGEVVYSPAPVMHFADPMRAVHKALDDVSTRFGAEKLYTTAFTGADAENVAEALPEIPYSYDSVSIPAGVAVISPPAEYVVHIGAKDSYFFHLNSMDGTKAIQEWKTGSKCGSGSGTLIEKQCRRLFQEEVEQENQKHCQEAANSHTLEQRQTEMVLERAEEEAQKSDDPSEFLARCGVVLQSDLIHKQNEGVNRADNLAGLFRAVARNYKIDVIGNKDLDHSKVAVATGGVVTNKLVKEHLEYIFDIPLQIPPYHQNVAAVGAAFKAMKADQPFVIQPEHLTTIQEHGRSKRKFAQPLYANRENVTLHEEEEPSGIPGGTDVVLGIDGGSTTTKGAMIDVNSGKLLDKLYIKTKGDPEGSLKQVLRYLRKHEENVRIAGIGTTGSARKLFEKMLLSREKTEHLQKEENVQVDRVIDEISCHARGVKAYNPDIDTIFEVGGQDMKFTTFNSRTGAVKNAKMNYSCQAGSGQTLENMADLIGLDVTGSLQEYALRAERVPLIDSTCGVFMEMDENKLIAEGFSREEIAAAIVRGTAASYYFKFVGGSQLVGDTCSAQGGPCLGESFLAALAQVTEKNINAYPHREMFGAWGAALEVLEEIRNAQQAGKDYASAFRGWEIIDTPLRKEEVTCRELLGEENCGVRNCKLQVFQIGEDKIVSGGFCPKGNSEASEKPKTNYVATYHNLFNKHFRKFGSLLEDLNEEPQVNTVGVRRSTATLGPKGIWSAALLKGLGMHPVVTPQSDSEIARQGIEHSRTDFCIARKLAAGHALRLRDHPGVKFIFNPAFVKVNGRPELKYCIYTESEPYLLSTELDIPMERQFVPRFEFNEPPALMIDMLTEELERIGVKCNRRRIKKAVANANQAEQDFCNDLYSVGDKFFEKINGDVGYVGIGRDYVLLDPQASSDTGSMFSKTRGLHYIPQLFLRHKYDKYPIEEIAHNEYWVQSVEIMKCQRFVSEQDNLFPIRMMNFGCGPDSMKLYQEQRIQDKADKPMLQLLTDAQTNNAPFVTRTEAFERVVESYFQCQEKA